MLINARDRFRGKPPPKYGLGLRRVDDGDPHVYIRTTWVSIAITVTALVALGAVLF